MSEFKCIADSEDRLVFYPSYSHNCIHVKIFTNFLESEVMLSIEDAKLVVENMQKNIDELSYEEKGDVFNEDALGGLNSEKNINKILFIKKEEK